MGVNSALAVPQRPDPARDGNREREKRKQVRWEMRGMHWQRPARQENRMTAQLRVGGNIGFCLPFGSKMQFLFLPTRPFSEMIR